MNYFSYLAQIIKEYNIWSSNHYKNKTLIIDDKDNPVYALWKKRYYYQLKYIIMKFLKKHILGKNLLQL